VWRREEEMMLICVEVLPFHAITHVLHLGIMIHHSMLLQGAMIHRIDAIDETMEIHDRHFGGVVMEVASW